MPSARVVPIIASIDLVGAWLSLVEHLVRDQGVGGSNPLAPTNNLRPSVSGTCEYTHPSLLNSGFGSMSVIVFHEKAGRKYCVLDEAGTIVLEQKLGTTPKAMKEVFGGMPRCRC